jgi:hypothetical protein
MLESSEGRLQTPDAKAAHEFLAELTTRIATRRLPYRDGVERTALESLVDVFRAGRAIVLKYPGCLVAKGHIEHILNGIIAPFTAAWHPKAERGLLDSRDGSDEFREQLWELQDKIREAAESLADVAEGPDGTRRVSREWDPVIQTGASGPRILASKGAEKLAAAPIHGWEKAEMDAVATRRSHFKLRDWREVGTFGLALSGGGIRSAAFSLGVVQVLADKGLLKEVDYLSTVSGGGYTGSFLTRRLGETPATGEPADSGKVDAPHGPDTSAIQYLRLNARYLSGDRLMARWVMACRTLAGMVLNWTAPVALVVLASAIGVMAGWNEDRFDGGRSKVLLVLWILVAGLLVLLGLTQRYRHSFAPRVETFFAIGTGVCLLLGLTAWLDALFLSWLTVVRGNLASLPNSGLTVAAVVAAIPAVLRFVPILENPRIRKWVLSAVVALAGLLVPLAAVLLFYALLDYDALPLTITGIGLLAVGLLAVDVNKTSPRDLYQQKLAQTFVQRAADLPSDIPLSSINANGQGPVHILNAAVNIPASQTAALKERGCDFFSFTKYRMGSTSTDYRPTNEWKEAGQEITLGTAMAISGAAASSHMGLGSMKPLVPLLTLLNVRLGYWIRWPGAEGASASPGVECLLREMTGIGMDEKAAWLNLSDGGHIENMGVYELLRRRCRFILCVDGEADPGFGFGGLMTLVRHARIDFGIQLNPLLDEIRPNPTTGYSRSHFHLCEIIYSGGDRGLFLYLKLSVTGNESELIRNYRAKHPEFPHQSTLDQFFDQEQFEVYRSLGVHIAESLFKPALMRQVSETATDKVQPDSVPDWFRRMEGNLL